MTISKQIAHVKLDNETGDWLLPHDLMGHLESVAQQAGLNAVPFESFAWCYAAGLWHDLGKYRAPFQYYIRVASGFERENAHVEREKSPGRVFHSTAGTLHAIKQWPGCKRIVVQKELVTNVSK
ncbi:MULTISPECIES: hypothetical protein [unclassified Halomonas]|uniref:hypothetical protein n=1 Tax=unclassified Halomonas TaxID=2609666 RepID=UPI000990884B|nr:MULTISPECIES: hypothetical protein [unclassified Halomonas]AQU84712.1 hypothetical protein B2G49_20220 [Halomonas sp. 'Soap Lake \